MLCSLGGRVLVPHQTIHTTISLSCFADTETPSRREKLMINDDMLPTACGPQTSWNLKVDDADAYLPPHQPIRRMSTSWSRPRWTITIKLLTILSKLRHIVFRGKRPPCPPLPGKVRKLSFSTAPKTLSPRFDSALVYREAELSASFLPQSPQTLNSPKLVTFFFLSLLFDILCFSR